jgi:oxygen-independent coproporphyrinogen-3 oxidase
VEQFVKSQEQNEMTPFFESLGGLLGEKQKSRIGFYFHVPFCAHLCPYCDFIKTTRFSPRDIDAFFENLLLQLNQELSELDADDLSHATVYFGGGTPGLFPPSRYEPILETLRNRFELEEVTIETNPLTNRSHWFEGYQKIGVNRVTVGAQSLCRSVLKLLGRQHTREDVKNTIYWARSAGIGDVQVDLIYGLTPGKRSHPLVSEISELVQYGATGISGYILTLEERTQFAKRMDLVDEDNCISEYEILYDTCMSYGFIQRETSNFALNETKHNNIYWHGLPYVGIGTGAHGLKGSAQYGPFGRRYKIGHSIPELAPGNDHLPFEQNVLELFCQKMEPPRTKEQVVDELIFTLLRTNEGVPLHIIDSILAVPSESILLKDPKIIWALERGNLVLQNHKLFLPWREKMRGDSWAMLVGNAVNPMRALDV